MNFQDEFTKKLAEYDIDYRVRGILTADKRVYSLSSDTKVLSTIFELFVRPVVYDIALQHNLVVEEAKSQTFYPDFTMMKDKDDLAKTAVDVKTSYRKKNGRTKFTLGGYSSFIRRETKNIQYPFSHYKEHWIIGFTYLRPSLEESTIPEHIYKYDEIDDIPLPYSDVEVFVQEKWRISGDTAGSGDTYNMGSINGTLEDFEKGRGVFNSEEEFLAYWRDYERTKEKREGKYKNIAEFREWQRGPST